MCLYILVHIHIYINRRTVYLFNIIKVRDAFDGLKKMQSFDKIFQITFLKYP